MVMVRGQLRGIATRPAKRAAMVAHAASMIHAAGGVDGDFGRLPGRAQVTVVSEEAWRAACDEMGTRLPWTLRRANLLVTGVPLRPLKSSRLVIGEVILEVTGETSPCHRMDEAHAGLWSALSPDARGGVRCRILAGGKIAEGDELVWEPAMADLFE